jgi:hypothetical protein
MNEVLPQAEVSPSRLFTLFRDAGIGCVFDDEDIDIRSADCGLYCIRIVPKPVLVEVFKEFPTDLPADKARDLANSLNGMSRVQWAYIQNSPPRLPFLLARVCVDFQDGLIASQLVCCVQDFPRMISGLMSQINARAEMQLALRPG